METFSLFSLLLSFFFGSPEIIQDPKIDPLAEILTEEVLEIPEAQELKLEELEVKEKILQDTPEQNSSKNNSLIQKSMPVPKTDLQHPHPQDTEKVAVMSTSQGKIVIRFFPEMAPKTVENFLGLSKKGYYDGIKFHRIIEGFMIQGGDPLGSGMGGESLWGASFQDEFHKDAKNNRGSLSMANSGPNTNGSQFFINQVNNNFLDNRHAVFGEVIMGMNIVDSISKSDKNAMDMPLKDILIETVKVVNYSEVKAEIEG